MTQLPGKMSLYQAGSLPRPLRESSLNVVKQAYLKEQTVP